MKITRSIRTQVGVILFLVLFVSFTTASLFIEQTLDARFAALEDREMETNIERAAEIIADRINYLGGRITDWAHWDESFRYMNTKSAVFEKGNLRKEQLDSIEIDSIRFFASDRTLFKSIDRAARDDGLNYAKLFNEELGLYPMIFPPIESKEIRTGILPLNGHFFAFAMQPIRPSSGEGKSRGYIFFARRIDASLVRRVSELLKLTVEMKASRDRPAFIQLEAGKPDYRGLTVKGIPLVYRAGFLKSGDDKVAATVTVQDVEGHPALNFSFFMERDLRQQGSLTIRAVIASFLITGLLTLIVLVAGLEKFVVSRILSLTAQVHLISKGNDPAARVKLDGANETEVLATRINEMLLTINDRNKVIRDIVENVHVGFLVVNADGIIEKGYTTYCHTLFGDQKLAGAKFSHILFDSKRERENFDVFFEQAMENLAPEDLTLAQLPSKVRYLDGKYLKVEASGLYGEADRLIAVLFTVSDITHLEQAERKNRENTALLKILKSIDHFAAFKAGARLTLEQLIDTRMAELDQARTRRAIHTLKGNFGVFGLQEIVTAIHDIESLPRVEHADIVKIQNVFSHFLGKHRELMGMDYQVEWNPIVTLPLERLQELADASRSWLDLNAARKYVESFAERAMGTTFGDLAAPLIEEGSQIALRLRKEVEFRVSGADVLLDPIRTRDLISNIAHAIRNAIDHGIETPHERQSLGKSPLGIIELGASSRDGKTEIYISDDGRGLESDKLTKSALKLNKVFADPVRSLTEEEISNLIFIDGVSSKHEANEISGRGIGLSALKAAVERIEGKVFVTWKNGNGTSIHLVFAEDRIVKAG